MKIQYVSSVFFIVFFFACSKAQPDYQSIPGIEVKPGSSYVNTGFFTPFKTMGKVLLEKGSGKESVFRYFEKEMDFFDWEGKKVIRQILKYSDDKKKPTGIHTTYYDPESLAVLFWEYQNQKNKKASFAFQMNGTEVAGTMDLSIPKDQWQRADIGVQLFQNESRELFFRSLNMEKGSTIKFPVVGMQPPYHGWISYTFDREEELDFSGKKHLARIWVSSSQQGTYYAVIDEAPYVIKRVVQAGKENHVFQYETLEEH